MNFRNPVYNSSGTIDCEIPHPEFGWIPFTASPDDSMEYGQQLFAEIVASGEPIAPYQPSIDTLADAKRAEIQSAMERELAAGMPYLMPDGSEEVIQTREQDETNLLNLAIEARDLRAAGVTEPTQYLRVLSNKVYQLTPEQMIAATDATQAFKRKWLNKAWRLKDDLNVAVTAGDIEAIQAIHWSSVSEREQ